MKIHEWIRSATTDLVGVSIGTAKLDAELILSHTLKKPRTWIHMYRDEELTERLQEIADARLRLRHDRVPLAYIIGHKEFYGRRFTVTPAVLIPRPESEAIIDVLKELWTVTPQLTNLVDIGTGSGCLGITAKLELPDLSVTLSDISNHALTVAKKNADTHQTDITLLQSDLLASYLLQPHIILANLPYVNPDWERSPETEHEPSLALFASDEGLSVINHLLTQASDVMQPDGILLLEADPVQHKHIAKLGQQLGFRVVKQLDYCIALRKL